MIRYTVDSFNEEQIDKSVIRRLIEKHIADSERIRTLEKYYGGNHSIFERIRPIGAPNAQVAINFAKYISDVTCGYFMSNPITYASTTGEDLEQLLMAFDRAEVDDTDGDNAIELSMTGQAFEYVYIKEGTSDIITKNLCAESTFLIYDTSIEERELAGVYYRVIRDDSTDQMKYAATVVTPRYIYEVDLYDDANGFAMSDQRREHYFGEVPIIEYLNNHNALGDYEQVISLIDAYDTVMSDRVNDVKEYVDAILVIYGTLLSDDSASEDAKEGLKKGKLLEFPDKQSMGAEWLTRQLDQNGVEVLQTAISKDILRMAHVPDFSDEHFAGNSSGVAIAYKTLMLEWLTKTKERYYRRGLRKRIRLFGNFLGLKQILVNASSVVPHFTRSLPVNTLENAQIVSMLNGVVSQRTLLQQLPFVEDPDAEIEAVEAQQEADTKRQQELFQMRPNLPPPDEGGEDE